MSHYERHYDQPTKQERLEAARQDCEAFLGDHYAKVLEAIRNTWENHLDRSKAQRYRLLRASLAMFVGIEGRYPVSAILRAALIREVEPPALHLMQANYTLH